MTHITVQCIKENSPGLKWSGLFYAKWPYYESWFLRNGGSKKGYLTSSNMLKKYMPEIFPVYEQLLTLSDGSDSAARFLSMYSPPAFMRGCSQMIYNKNSESILVRNYEYLPAYFEGVMLYSNWKQPVIGISDCLWGLLDGINSNGLAASLAFGGSNEVKEGFGIPLIIRYLLETTNTVDEAIAVLKTIPSHMAYNVQLCDAHGNAATVFVKPGGGVVVTSELTCTNHQDTIAWELYHKASKSGERKQFLEQLLAQNSLTEQQVVQAMLAPPLYFETENASWSTLYTAAYNCIQKEVVLLWPFAKLKQSFSQFNETTFQIELNPPSTKV